MKSVPFKFKPESKTKLYFQLYKKIVEAIQKGDYQPDDKIPSVRVMAQELSVSKNTVISAYKLLLDNGYIVSHLKSGFTINKEFPETMPENQNYFFSTADDEYDIPTVDSIFKEREGTDVQQIPIPKELNDLKSEMTISNIEEIHPIAENKEPFSFSAETSKVQKPKNSEPEKENSIAISPEELALIEKLRTPVQTQPKKEETSETQEPAAVQAPEPVKAEPLFSKPSKPKPAVINQDIFGQRGLRKAIAMLAYNNYQISCTSGQIFVAENMMELITNLSKILLPNNNSAKGKGLLKRAQDIINGYVDFSNNSVYISKNISQAISTDLKSVNYNTVILDKQNNSIDFELLYNSDSKIVILSPEADSIEDKEELIDWATSDEEHFIVEAYFDFSKENVVPICSEISHKTIFIGNFASLSFMILPSTILNKYKEAYKDTECSLSVDKQLIAENKINQLNESLTADL